MVLGLFSASEFFYSKHLAKEQKRTTKDIFKDLFGLFISALPALLLLIYFSLNTTLTSFKYSQSTQRSLEELIDWLIDVKPLVAYIPPEEHTYTRPFLYILVVVVIATITGFFFSKKNSNAAAPTRNHYGFLILCAMSISLMLYFVIPDGQGAGMMSDRYCLFFFMFCILWASIQSVPKWLGSFLIIVILFCHFQLLSYQYKKALIPLSKDASCISKAADHIKDNSLIFTIDLSGNWLQGHYGDYIAIQKPVVVLDSYEAAIGWFPLKWNTTQLPQVQLAGKSSVAGIFWPSNNTAAVKRNIDYVLVYGNNDVLKEVQWAEVKEVLTKNFKLIYAADNYVFLYQMN
ncbi:MAG: hypothetical protein IPP32_04410 [Bacteroidetes bacterium]|nr:hypothetical protein [Bacteroidota bacterium]